LERTTLKEYLATKESKIEERFTAEKKDGYINTKKQEHVDRQKGGRDEINRQIKDKQDQLTALETKQTNRLKDIDDRIAEIKREKEMIANEVNASFKG